MKTIVNDDEVLALANVINPGGQRILEDGTVKPGLEFHETNCAFVALATAAFLQDGTEVGAPCAPSALLIRGNSFLVTHAIEGIDSKTTCEEIDLNDNSIELEKKVKEIVDQYPGQSFLVHGHGDNGHHWFNITPEGKVIDIQSGITGHELLQGQRAFDGLRKFNRIDIYPVAPDISGKSILDTAQAVHQFNGMINLSRYMQTKFDPDFNLNISGIVDSAIEPYLASKISTDTRVPDEIENDVMHVWFNEYIARLTEVHEQNGGNAKDIQEELVRALDPQPELEVDGVEQTWLSEAQFRKPASTEREISIAELYAGRCPVISDAYKQLEGTNKMAAPETGAAINR
ncbi:MAG: hypothetical protein U0R17_07645 [Acidimicrobiia bacterium]